MLFLVQQSAMTANTDPVNNLPRAAEAFVLAIRDIARSLVPLASEELTRAQACRAKLSDMLVDLNTSQVRKQTGRETKRVPFRVAVPSCTPHSLTPFHFPPPHSFAFPRQVQYKSLVAGIIGESISLQRVAHTLVGEATLQQGEALRDACDALREICQTVNGATKEVRAGGRDPSTLQVPCCGVSQWGVGGVFGAVSAPGTHTHTHTRTNTHTCTCTHPTPTRLVLRPACCERGAGALWRD